MTTVKVEQQTLPCEFDSHAEIKTTWFPSLNNWDIEDLSITGGFTSTRPASKWSKEAIGRFVSSVKKESELRMRRTHNGMSKFNRLPIYLLISLANIAFGYDGWHTEIVECEVTNMEHMEFDDSREDRYTMTSRSVVKLILVDGTYIENEGKGECEFLSDKGQCHSKVKKEAISDGLKNCLYSFEELLLNYEANMKAGYYTHEYLK